MYLRKVGAFLLISSLLSGCQQPGPVTPTSLPPPSLIPVSAVINVVKCELNYTFAQDKRFQALVGATGDKHGEIKGTLHLENVVAGSTTDTAGLEFSPLKITVGPSGSIVRTRTNTQVAEVNFKLDIDPAQPKPAQCVDQSSGARLEIAGHPFVPLLEGILTEYSKINHGDPKIQLEELDYTSQFDVEEDLSGGIKVEVLIFSAEHTYERDYTTTQALELDFDLSSLAPTLQNY